MLYLLGILIFIHGILHLLGFTNAFGIGAMTQLDSHIPKPIGILWLGVAILFTASSFLLFLHKENWWVMALVATLFSQVLIFSTWKDSRYGTIFNVAILFIVVLTWGNVQFENTYRYDVKKTLEAQAILPSSLLTEEDLLPLPIPVQRYLRNAGVVNQPKVKNMHVIFEGEMREKGNDYFSFTSEQYNFFDEPTRYFFMKADLFGVKVPGYHRYINANASMDIRLFGLFPMINHEGAVMNKTETVTFFNDMCLLAPGALIDKRIKWRTLDPNQVEAIFEYHDIRITARLYFNEDGELINFISTDRTEMNEMKNYPFSTPVHGYQPLQDGTIMTGGDAVWHYPTGNFTYGKFVLKNIEYNISN